MNLDDVSGAAAKELLPIVKPMSLTVAVYTDNYQPGTYTSVGDVRTEMDGELWITDRRGIAVAKFQKGTWEFYTITAYDIPGDHDHEAAKAFEGSR